MEFEKRKKETEKEKLHPLVEERDGIECPRCGITNEKEAGFCGECSYDFNTGRHCPGCDAKVSANADICEACGEWLLEGKCKFCYTEIEEGEAYCGECGNPIAGINCPQCGELSYFDFCKHCNIPLSARAKKMQEDLKSNDEELEFLELLGDFTPEEEAEKSSQREEMLSLRAYAERVEEKEKKGRTFTTLFSEKQKESIKEAERGVEKEIKKREVEKRKKEAERKRQEAERQERLREQLQKMKAKRFSDNQKARLYFNTHRPGSNGGWRCNFANVVHSYPEACAEPRHGGQWVI